VRFLIFIFWNGKLRFIRKARTIRGVQASVRNAMRYTFPHNRVETRVLSVEEILEWEKRGLEELEALCKA
jgi:hypothetical protein